MKRLLIIIRHKLEAEIIYKGLSLQGNKNLFMNKNESIILQILPQDGEKIIEIFSESIIKYKPDLILNFGISGSIKKHMNIGDLVQINDFYLCDSKEKKIISKLDSNNDINPGIKKENLITLKTVDENIDEEYFTQYGGLLDLEGFYYRKTAFDTDFISLKLISDRNRNLDNISIKDIKELLASKKREIIRLIISLL